MRTWKYIKGRTMIWFMLVKQEVFKILIQYKKKGGKGPYRFYFISPRSEISSKILISINVSEFIINIIQ